MVSQARLDEIGEMFLIPDLIGLWPEILDRYQKMGFTDAITDDQRIDEFSYIAQQYYKYVFSRQTIILDSNSSLEEMLSNIENMIIKAKIPKGKNDDRSMRPMIVYCSMRDDWLNGMYHLISNMIASEKRTDDGNDW